MPPPGPPPVGYGRKPPTLIKYLVYELGTPIAAAAAFEEALGGAPGHVTLAEVTAILEEDVREALRSAQIRDGVRAPRSLTPIEKGAITILLGKMKEVFAAEASASKRPTKRKLSEFLDQADSGEFEAMGVKIFVYSSTSMTASREAGPSREKSLQETRLEHCGSDCWLTCVHTPILQSGAHSVADKLRSSNTQHKFSWGVSS